MGTFFIRSRADNSVVRGRIRPNFEHIHVLLHVIVTCKYEKDPIKNIRENVMTPFFPLKLYWSYLLPWKPEFLTDLHQNAMQPFPYPTDASDKICLRSACWPLRYSCLKMVDDDRRTTTTTTDAGAWIYYKLTFEPSTQVS